MKYFVSVFCLLVVLWLGNSGHYSGLLLTLGLLSVIFVIFVVHRMDVLDHESQPLQVMGRKLPGYYFWLMAKIVRSNIDVVILIWRGPTAISPSVATLPVSQSSDIGRVIYANSITLTPGTVTMDLSDDTVLVHALTLDAVKELEGGEMSRRVSAVERGD